MTQSARIHPSEGVRPGGEAAAAGQVAPQQLQGHKIAWVSKGEWAALGVAALIVLGSLLAAYLPGAQAFRDLGAAQHLITAGYVLGALGVVCAVAHAGRRWGEPYREMEKILGNIDQEQETGIIKDYQKAANEKQLNISEATGLAEGLGVDFGRQEAGTSILFDGVEIDSTTTDKLADAFRDWLPAGERAWIPQTELMLSQIYMAPLALMQQELATSQQMKFSDTGPWTWEFTKVLGADGSVEAIDVTHRRSGVLVDREERTQVRSPEFQMVLKSRLAPGAAGIAPSQTVLELQDTRNNTVEKETGRVHVQEGGVRWHRAYDALGGRLP